MPFNASKSEEEFGSWRADGHPLTIEYSLMVLEELRMAGEEGFQKIAHGGVEVGALLFGRHASGHVRIEEWRPIECEHARGPGFLLSENDLTALEKLIEQTAAAPELKDLCLVGWYHTRTRSRSLFSAEDKSIQDLLFPEPWQVALVLRLTKDQPPSAGFFVRDPDGGMRIDSSYREFIARPNAAMLLRPPRATALVRVHQQATSAAEPPRREPSRRREPPPRQQWWDTQPAGPPVAVEPRQPPAYVHPDATPHEQIVAEMPQTHFRWRLLLVAFVLVMVAGAAVLSRPYWTPQSTLPISLRVEEVEDQIVIRWDHKSEVVRGAERGVIQITDAGRKREIALDQLEARAGSLTLIREGEDVQVRLAFYRAGQPEVEEFARFLGSPVKAKVTVQPEQSEQEKQQLSTDVDNLKQALQQESIRSQRLRESVKGLEDRLKKDESRRLKAP